MHPTCIDVDSYPSASGWTAFIYILKGTLIVGRESIPQEQFHTLVLSANQNETGVLLKSGSEDTEFMLVSCVWLRVELSVS
jgi:redox-sensitive bicupin YhaK (pirin superfamily)